MTDLGVVTVKGGYLRVMYAVDPLPGHVSLECCDVFLVDAVLGTDLHHFTSDQEALLLVRCGHINVLNHFEKLA